MQQRQHRGPPAPAARPGRQKLSTQARGPQLGQPGWEQPQLHPTQRTALALGTGCRTASTAPSSAPARLDTPPLQASQRRRPAQQPGQMTAWVPSGHPQRCQRAGSTAAARPGRQPRHTTLVISRSLRSRLGRHALLQTRTTTLGLLTRRRRTCRVATSPAATRPGLQLQAAQPLQSSQGLHHLLQLSPAALAPWRGRHRLTWPAAVAWPCRQEQPRQGAPDPGPAQTMGLAALVWAMRQQSQQGQRQKAQPQLPAAQTALATSTTVGARPSQRKSRGRWPAPPPQQRLQPLPPCQLQRRLPRSRML